MLSSLASTRRASVRWRRVGERLTGHPAACMLAGALHARRGYASRTAGTPPRPTPVRPTARPHAITSAGLTPETAAILADMAATLHRHELDATGLILTEGGTVDASLDTRGLLSVESAAPAMHMSGAEDDLTSTIMLDWLQGTRGEPAQATSVARAAGVGAGSGPIALVCADDDPAVNVRQLLTMGGRSAPRGSPGASRSTSVALSREEQSATELLLQGLDVKAVMTDNTLRDLRLYRKCVSQADFTFTRWESVHARQCDFAMSIFYKGLMRAPCVFERCCFDGCVLTGLTLEAGGAGGGRGGVVFLDCSFRRAAVGITLTPGAAPPGGAVFVGCDFDLATFERCHGFAGHPEAFQGCVNTRTAACFPLRARGA